MSPAWHFKCAFLSAQQRAGCGFLPLGLWWFKSPGRSPFSDFIYTSQFPSSKPYLKINMTKSKGQQCTVMQGYHAMSLLCQSLFSHSLLLSQEAVGSFGAFACPSPAPAQDSSSALAGSVPSDHAHPSGGSAGCSSGLSSLPWLCPRSSTDREQRRNTQTFLLGKSGSRVWEEGRKLLVPCSAQSIPASCRVFERLKKTLGQCIQPNVGSDALGGRKSFLGEEVHWRMV